MKLSEKKTWGVTCDVVGVLNLLFLSPFVFSEVGNLESLVGTRIQRRQMEMRYCNWLELLVSF